MDLYFIIAAGKTAYINGVNLVPGTVALANESGQNSAALKNITIDTGTTLFNTAIEYDTDVNNTAYSRVKHYINNGKAYSYTYDQAGNISKITNPDGSWVSYEYDSLNQLTREYHSLPCVKGGAEGEAEAEGLSYDTIEYTYDTRGNILSKTYSLNGETVDTIAYTYTDTTWKDRLTSYNGVTITADTIGNPLNWINGETLTWQRGRQLASLTKNGVTTTYSYNDDGIRTSKKVGNVTTTYSVVDGTLRRMSDGTNTLQFVYGNGLSSVIYNGTEYWYVFNAQGDVIGLIDASGNYVVEYTYDSWGKPLSKTGSLADTLGTINPFRYRGYIYDEESGFYYCQSRYYDPEVGRWLNVDGFLATTETTIGHNMFAYCGNNPVALKDSSGYFWETVFDVISLSFSISEVIMNPTDVGAWVNVAADALDLIPFVTGVGEITRAVRLSNAVVDAVDTVTDTAKAIRVVDNSSDAVDAVKPLNRPYIRKHVRETVEQRAQKAGDYFLDANEKTPIIGKYDLGHVTGHEFHHEVKIAMEKGWTQKQFNDYMNNPDFYQIEDPHINRSHKYEMRWD